MNYMVMKCKFKFVFRMYYYYYCLKKAQKNILHKLLLHKRINQMLCFAMLSSSLLFVGEKKSLQHSDIVGNWDLVKSVTYGCDGCT